MTFFGLWGLIAFLVLVTVFSFGKLRHGALKGLEFPRQQVLLTALASALIVPFTMTGAPLACALALLTLVSIVQLGWIVKFTPLWPRQSVDATTEQQDNKDPHISLLAANVKMSNREYGRLVKLVQTHQPDVLMAIEVDAEWSAALISALGAAYPHQIDVPQDNGYGICVLSRLVLSDIEVRDLITKGVPSVRTRVTLRDGRDLRLYVVHPEPPVVDHDTLGRDGEIAQVGIEAKEDPLPSIVSGDLNDVAWSTTTRQFQRLSGLLDPRVGRGFYNTFSATHPWMRWPLDHLFHDPKFRLIDMARLEKIGSDHFPMLFVLAMAKSKAMNTDPGTADLSETADIKEMIDQEKRRDRRAIGEDWEADT